MTWDTAASIACIVFGFMVGLSAPRRILIPIAIIFAVALIASKYPSDPPLAPGIATVENTAPVYVYKEAREANRGLGPGGSICMTSVPSGGSQAIPAYTPCVPSFSGGK